MNVIADSNREGAEHRETGREEAALRRIATVVGEGVEPHELFAVVAEAVARVVDAPSVGVTRYEPDGTATACGTFPPEGALFRTGTRISLDGANVLSLVRASGEPARIDDYTGLEGEIADAIRRNGLRSSVGVPIVVAGRVWGAIVTSNTEQLPQDTEGRLAAFTELLAAAIANTEAREALAQLADEQAALRRVGTLVAQGAAPAEIFATVTAEVDRVFGLDPMTFDFAAVGRFHRGRELVIVGISKSVDVFPLGSHWPPHELFASTHVLRTGRSVRIRADDVESADSEVAEFLRQHAYRSQVASPIVVDGHLWGVMSVYARNDFPPDTGERLERFTELVATAIANAESRGALARLADEQAALRRVATLVAKEDLPEKMFAKVAEETGRLFGGVECTLLRNEGDGAATNVGTWGEKILAVFPLGTSFLPDGDGVAATVLRTGHPHRIDDYSVVADPIARSARDRGIESSVGCPIVVRGAIWGAIVVGTTGAEPFPPETEMRLTQFADLVATAVANAEARGEILRLADEQAALRRVATLVAEGAPSDAVCRAVIDEVARVVGPPTVTLSHHHADGSFTVVAATNNPGFPVGSRWPLDGPSLAATIHETGRVARIDDYSTLGGAVAAAMHSSSIRAAAGSPIVVDGKVWGHISVAAKDSEPLPAGTEQRLLDFTELVATAIANAESSDALSRLADEQAALRRVATLVAEGAAPGDLFNAVAWEVGQQFDFAAVTLNRYEDDAVVVLADPLDSGFPVGSRWPFDGDSLAVRVHATRRMARIDDYSDVESSAAVRMRERASRSAIGVPIFVEGDLWGLLCVGAAATELLPADTADRIAGFVELVGTAIANGQARDRLRLLAEEQTALRRVATLVARDAPPGEVFNAVAMEVGKLLDADVTVVGRYDGDGAATATGSWSSSPGGVPVGTRSALGGRNVLTLVAETGAPARVDGYDGASGEAAEIARRHGWRSSIAAPISVDDRVWGVTLVATQRPELFPVGAEERLSAFTDLVGTAIANAEARGELERLAAEQAALRRVATLVAEAASPHDLFEAVAEEVGRVLPVGSATMGRFEPDGSVTTMASWSTTEAAFPTGRRWPTEGTNVAWMVLQTGRPARIDDFSAATDPIGVAAREAGMKSAVGTPIVVEGHLWGVMTATSNEGAMPPRTEARLASFTELVATAIANAETSGELAASRRRIVAAGDEARRRIERDLHDGIQQRLIALTFRARAMMRRPSDELPGIAAELSEGLKNVSDELRDVSRGIHPTILTEAGLGPALRALARRSDVPIDVDIQLDERLPPPVEAAAYYIASEALTNVAKHAHANVVRLIAAHGSGVLTLEVRDDGIGGVDPTRGSGILGLTDRVEALGGTISIASRPHGGTTLTVHLPSAT
ncbi:MAG: GAF domain-containing protein [Gaiellaceae bacterium]